MQLVDLHAESAEDTQSEGRAAVGVQAAAQQVRHPQDATTSSEVARGSEFRLAWLMVEGWRAQLRKGGDVVEKARWEWRVEDLMAQSRARRASIPDIVARVPSSMKGSVRSGGNRNTVVARSQAGSTKSVRWRAGT